MGFISTYQKRINNLNRLLTMLFLLFHEILSDYLQETTRIEPLKNKS